MVFRSKNSQLIGLPILVSFIIACGPTQSDEEEDGTNASNPKDITNEPFTSTEVDCDEHVGEYFSSDVFDVHNSTSFDGDVSIVSTASNCTVSSNGMPNHDFNDSNTGSFAHDALETNYVFDIIRSPTEAGSNTEFRNGEDEGVMLNGVPIAILTSTCWDDDCEWRENPFYGPKSLSIDSNHGHTNSSGEYHYHGNPVDLYDSSGATESAVVGYAADGFPIFGPYFEDPATNVVREVVSSFRLKSGSRPGDGSPGSAGPGGTYTGEWREDYEYVENLGDLDDCNGMTRNDQYAYYVTTTYPYLMACFKGSPDDSFNSRSIVMRSLLGLSIDEHIHPHH